MLGCTCVHCLRLHWRQCWGVLRQQQAPPTTPSPAPYPLSSYKACSPSFWHCLTASAPEQSSASSHQCVHARHAAMNVGIYVCVILAALFTGSLTLPSKSMRTERKALVIESLPVPLTNHTRQARSAPAPPSGQLQSESAQNSLSQLLARLLSRKSSSLQTRSSLTSRAAAPSHRIKDRDYLGWMDFGRRSVEEYEYSP
uniref:Gastrin/cholecystokinin peptide hormone domain-containing protein n=1 Tax=Oryzias latipes TaxID=8090 RepID=A0A3P9IV08_ORYLA